MLKILTGLISGIVSGTGMGGGTILILILSLFMGIDQHIAQATNLVFFVKFLEFYCDLPHKMPFFYTPSYTICGGM